MNTKIELGKVNLKNLAARVQTKFGLYQLLQ